MTKRTSKAEIEAWRKVQFADMTPEEHASAESWASEYVRDMQLSGALRLARQASGMTQQQLADKTGINQGEISRMLSKGANPKFKTLCKVVEALGGRVEITWPEAKGKSHSGN
jgi:DNA-binding phage protein